MDSSRTKVEKRNRPPVSCEPCRSRKLKCNRASPCDTCIKRNQAPSCQYATNANRGKPGVFKKSNVTDRLKNLEDFVSSFLVDDVAVQPQTQTNPGIASGNQRVTPAPPGWLSSALDLGSGCSVQSSQDETISIETPRVLESRDGQVNYVDPSHWLSILEDIKEIREHLTPSDSSILHDGLGNGGSPLWEPEASFLFGFNQNPSLHEILASLPPQPVCDRLLSHYFGSRFMVLGIVHPTKFQKEYEKFWEAPSKAPTLWIALLFAVLSLTAILRQLAKPGETESDAAMPSVKILQQRTAQCLILGKYTTANAYALEAFVLHFQSCYLSQTTPPIHLWFEFGTIIRLAFRMGCHRDPINLPGISPFDGEMRRRVWLNIFQVEALMSFQLGFPTMIPTEYCDTQVPRNLEYSDLYVEMETLPPGRPLSQNTPVQYTIVKASVMEVFKKISAHTQHLTAPSYHTTLALDGEMREVYGNLPECLKRRDVGRSFMDHSSLILDRCTIELLYLKALVVLHRRYINYEPDNPRFEPSRRACMEAALDILARQADIHHASRPGGRLCEDKWMVSSLTAHDFLLAAMVVCLGLSVRMRSAAEREPGFGGTREYRALQTSRQIWGAESTNSPDARIAALALGLMIDKVTEHNDPPSPQVPPAVSADFELPYAETMSGMIDGLETLNWSQGASQAMLYATRLIDEDL
ncbi:hypothetical protein QBC33DRAFT_614721 [Phialemonium atrogriseum]|uniref:Zn(2)-C6 fungal-type domain-containing protein n=1 Tax=Phialemonium atrogriseum TaxID=1093897 RepID=A0AAJ0BRJ4_9PEZI|nr:uncharacterized protein QBC33DRAFT_614721 [Phialemonium atrogriseum]KAK1761707.1 hypothetical protein QBC33DRAFT_614721 [Phialemonium atrogriseum]